MDKLNKLQKPKMWQEEDKTLEITFFMQLISKFQLIHPRFQVAQIVDNIQTRAVCK